MDSKRIVLALVITAILAVSVVVLVLNMSNTPQIDDGDITPPVITVTSPGNQSQVFGAVSLSFTATDDNSIGRYEIHIDGEIVSVRQAYNWNTMDVTDGLHTITFRARDPDVNWGETRIIVTVDNSVVPEYEFSNMFKILAYNIEETGINEDWKEVVKEENADIVMLVETGNFDDNGNQELREAVQELNEYFTDETPYSGFTAQDIFFSTSGEAVLSRYPVLAFYQIPVVTLDDDTGYDVTHDFVDAVIDINGTSVHFIGMHLKAGGGDSNKDRRNWENEGIINYMDNLGNVPIVYLGDMNSYSPEDNVTIDNDYGYGPMTMLVDPDDPTFGQFASEVHNFTDVYRALYPEDLGYTYGHQYTALLGRIDYIIVNDFFNDKLVNSTVGDTAHANTGSDHYCIDAFISWDETGTVNITEPNHIEISSLFQERTSNEYQSQIEKRLEDDYRSIVAEMVQKYYFAYQVIPSLLRFSSHQE